MADMRDAAPLDQLAAIQADAGRGRLDPADFERARSLIGHDDNDVRWQALIAVAEWIPSTPEAVWAVVLEHGTSDDEDMRAGVATVLLEHLLEEHFDQYFPQLRARIQAGAPQLADTLGSCWPMGNAHERWDEVRALLATQ